MTQRRALGRSRLAAGTLWRLRPWLLLYSAVLAIPVSPLAGQQQREFEARPAARRTDGFRVVFGRGPQGAVGQMRCNNVIVTFQDPAHANAGDGEENDADQPGEPAAKPLVQLLRGTADEFAFGPGATEAQARSSVDVIGKSMVMAVDRVCSLSAAQRHRLELAASGDAKRYFDRADAIKAKFEAYGELASMDQFREWAGELERQTAELHASALFGESSLFTKVLGTVLTPEQAAALAARPLPAPDISLRGDVVYRLKDAAAAPVRPAKAAAVAGAPANDPARLETILKEWEQAASKIKRLDCDVFRIRYDYTFGVEKRATGSLAVDGQGRAVYDVSPAQIRAGQVGTKKAKNGEPMKLEADPAERWHWTETSIIRIDDKTRTFEEIKLPELEVAEQPAETAVPPKEQLPADQDAAAASKPAKEKAKAGWGALSFVWPREFPLARPFLVGMPVADLRQRFEIELLKETQTTVWLKLKPKRQRERARFTEATLILRLDGYLPQALRMIDPSGTETVHTFRNVRVDGEGADLAKRPDLNGYRAVLSGARQPPPD